MTVTVDASDVRLPDLLDRAAAGEDIVITRDGTAVARLTPVEPSPRPRAKRGLGLLAGRIAGPPDHVFFDPLPEDELASWT